MNLVVRTAARDHTFPAVGWSISDVVKDSVQEIAAIACAALSQRQLEGGGNLGVQQPLRIGWLHALAIEAEAKGRFAYADFLYGEMDHDLSRIDAADGWAGAVALAITPEAASQLAKPTLRRAFLRELKVDSHLALFNASAKAGSQIGSKRLLRQLERAEQLYQRSGDDEAGAAIFEFSLAGARLAALQAGEHWLKAANLVEGYVRRFPQRTAFAKVKAQLHLAKFVIDLNATKTESQRAAASQRMIAGLKADGLIVQAGSIAPELYGIAYRQLAIAKANEGRLDEALADIRRALDYSPWQEGGQEVEQDIHQAMANLQSQIAALERQIASQWNAQLNPEGERLRKIARSGVSKRDQYMNSGEREAILRTARLGHALSIWRRFGLPALPKDQFPKALVLYDVVTEILAARTSETLTLAAVEEAAKRHECPPEVNLDDVLRFLNDEGAFPGEQDEAFPAGPQENAPIAAQQIPSAPRDSVIPFRPWFRSRQSRAWKTAAAASLLFVVCSSALFGFDLQQRSAKAEALMDISRAWTSRDDDAARGAIARFRSITTFAGNDERDGTVDRIEAALEELPNLRVRDQAFERLLRATAASRHGDALDAAERFLSAAPKRQTDPRNERVETLYGENLFRWLATDADAADGALAEKRIETYSKLMHRT